MSARLLAALALIAPYVSAFAEDEPKEVTCVVMLGEAAETAGRAIRFYQAGIGESGLAAASQARSLERQATECRASVEPMSSAAQTVWREQHDLYQSNMQVLAAVVKAIVESRE